MLRFSFMVFFIACSSESPVGVERCAENQLFACQCDNGEKGMQVCHSGALSECSCMGVEPTDASTLLLDGDSAPDGFGSSAADGQDSGLATDSISNADNNLQADAGNCSFSCMRWQICVNNRCALDPSFNWYLTVNSGTVSSTKPDGSNWDTDSGIDSAPDPQVCFRLARGTRDCTLVKQNTTSTLWQENIAGALTIGNLIPGIYISMVDFDGTSNTSDIVCPEIYVALSESDFPDQTNSRGVKNFTFSCPYGMASYTIRAP